MPGRVLAVRCTGVGRGLTRAYAGEVRKQSKHLTSRAFSQSGEKAAQTFDQPTVTDSGGGGLGVGGGKSHRGVLFFLVFSWQDAKFVIESRDVHRNKTTSGCKPFVVSVRGVVSPQVHCIKGDNGEYHYSYRTAKVKTRPPSTFQCDMSASCRAISKVI